MVQRSQQLGLPLEPLPRLFALEEFLWQHLDRDLSSEPRVRCPPDLAHPPCAQRRKDFIRTETGSRRKAHGGNRGIIAQGGAVLLTVPLVLGTRERHLVELLRRKIDPEAGAERERDKACSCG